MEPSTRTPEGEPNRCPVCGKRLQIEPSRPPGDAPCPHCGHLLWFDPSVWEDDDLNRRKALEPVVLIGVRHSMYQKVAFLLLGYDILVILLILAGPWAGIPPFVVFPFAVVPPIIGLGITPLLALLIFAIVTTPDDPQRRSENMKRCKGLLLLALLGFAPLIFVEVVFCVTSILR